MRGGSSAPSGGMEVEAKDLTPTGHLFISTEVRVPDNTTALFGHHEAGEVEGAVGQDVVPHPPSVCRCLLENIGLKEIDVGDLPGRRVRFADLFCVGDSCPTNDDGLLGHPEMFVRHMRPSKP